MSHDGFSPTCGPPLPSPLSEEERYRVGAWQLLAALLRSPPERSLLDRLAALGDAQGNVTDDLAMALRMLGLAARTSDPARLDDEYHELFIGLGRGELVPFASWYLTGFLMETPLAALRDELARLGFERRETVHEPEDHAAALCEVMAALIEDPELAAEQGPFFRAHIAPWMERFFTDLVAARSAVFYRSVGRLGCAFLALESDLHTADGA